MRNGALLFIFFFLTFSQVHAQYSITGKLVDTTNNPLMGAEVQLKTNTDSAIVGTISEEDGSFTFEQIQSGNYALHITYLGLAPSNIPITVDTQNVNLGTYQIKMGDNVLDGVQITAIRSPVQQIDDTTQYNAASFKTNPDATAEDLVRKMPGIDMSSGSPKAQGEKVSKVLVDGKPFFGDDPTSTLRNLPADIVDKIQVYDEQSDQAKFSGFDDGQTSKTINIITRGNVKEGSFGRAYAGYGYNNKYNVGGNANLFKEDRRLTVIAQSNNVNVQNFEGQDLVGVPGGGRGGGPMRGGGGSNFMVGQQDGIALTNAAGVNYSNKFFDKKLELSGSYFFNNSTTDVTQDIDRNYIMAGSQGQNYKENNDAHNVNYNHRFNLKVEYDIDSLNSISFKPNLSIQTNKSNSEVIGSTFQNNDALNYSATNSNTLRNGINTSASLMYRRKFLKKGRSLSLEFTPSYSNNNTDGKYKSNNLYYQNTILNDTLDQQYENDRNNTKINTRLNYTEPLTKALQLQAQYQVYFSKSNADKQTFNYSNTQQGYYDFDTALSNKFGNSYISHSPGLTLRISDSNLRMGIGAYFQYATLKNNRVLPYASTFSKSFSSFLPSVFLRYKFSKTKNLRFFFRTNTNEPSVEQLQDVVDNSNPLQLSMGNPLLKQSYDASFRGFYSSVNTATASNFFIMMSATATRNYISNSTFIAQQDSLLSNGMILARGSQLSQPINLNGYWNLYGFTSYGQMIKPLKLNANASFGLGYTKTPALINAQKSFSENKNINLGITLSSNISENIDFTLSSNSALNFVSYTLNNAANNNYFNQNTRLGLNYIFWKGMVFNTELNHQYYRGMSQGFNQSFLLWNMAIGKKIFKNQQGEIRLSVYDLLKQNNNIKTTVTESYYQDVITNNLQQYFMLSFNYKFRKFKGVKDENEFGDDGPKYGPPPGMIHNRPPGSGHGH